MNRSEKEQRVEALSGALAQARLLCLADFQGLNVEEISALRRSLRASKAEIHVVKNTLAKRAIRGTPLQELEPYLAGPTAIAYTSTDPVEPAKALIRFAKDNPKLKLKAGFLEGKVLSADGIEDLSKLPAREVLLASLLGTLKSPPTALVNVLSGILRKLLWVLRAIEESKGKTAGD